MRLPTLPSGVGSSPGRACSETRPPPTPKGTQDGGSFATARAAPRSLIVVAADTLADLEAEVARVEQHVYAGSGASMLFKQEGRVSSARSPGTSTSASWTASRSRGCAAAFPATRTTSSRRARTQRIPTRESLARSWSGPASSCSATPVRTAAPTGRSGAGLARPRRRLPPAPAWAEDGSYLVFRRLRQDVYRFHQFLRAEATRLELDPEALGSRLVGRWSLGAPTMRAPGRDNPRLAGDDCANNHFGYRNATRPLWTDLRDMCSDHTYRRAPGDPLGELCPYSAHIRKAYPRDDLAGSQPAAAPLTASGHPVRAILAFDAESAGRRRRRPWPPLHRVYDEHRRPVRVRHQKLDQQTRLQEAERGR